MRLFISILVVAMFLTGCQGLVPQDGEVETVIPTIVSWEQDDYSWELGKQGPSQMPCQICEMVCGQCYPECPDPETCESLNCCEGMYDECDSCCEACPECEDLECCDGLIDPSECPDCVCPECPEPETCESLECCEGLINPCCCPDPVYETGDLTVHFTVENLGIELVEDYEFTIEIKTADLNDQEIEIFTEVVTVEEIEPETTLEFDETFDVDDNLVVWVETL